MSQKKSPATVKWTKPSTLPPPSIPAAAQALAESHSKNKAVNKSKKVSASNDSNAAASSSKTTTTRIAKQGTVRNGREQNSKSLPITKIRQIMGHSPDADDVKLSGEAVHAMARATEAFVELLTRGAAASRSNRHGWVGYNDLSQFVHTDQRMNFIQDILPRKERYSEVQRRMSKNRKKRKGSNSHSNNNTNNANR